MLGLRFAACCHEISTRMALQTSTERMHFDILAPDRMRPVQYPAEQQAVRLLVALALAGHLFWLLPDHALRQPALALVTGYAFAQHLLAWAERRLGESILLSVAITALDAVVLLTGVVCDPAAGLPALALLPGFAALALFRWPASRLPAIWLTLIAVVVAGLLIRPEIALAGTADLPWQSLLLLPPAFLLLQTMRVLADRLHRADQLRPGEDPLTGLGNRAALYAAADALLPLMRRQHAPVTLMQLMLTMPHGSRRRDELLACRLLAHITRNRLRVSDVVVHYALGHIVVLLPDCPSTAADGISVALRERFREALAAEGLSAGLQIGAIGIPEDPVAMDFLLASLAEAMHRVSLQPGDRGETVHLDPEVVRQQLAG